MKGIRFDKPHDLMGQLLNWSTSLDRMTTNISYAYHNVDLFDYRKQKSRLKAITTELKQLIKWCRTLVDDFNAPEYRAQFEDWFGVTLENAENLLKDEISPVIIRADAKWESIKEQLKEQGRW